MKSYRFLFFLVLFVLLAAPAAAQVGKFGIGAHGTLLPSVTDNGDDEDGREFAFGVQARMRFTDNLGFEASVEFREEMIDDDVTLKLYPIQFSLLYYLLPSSRVGIYALGGLGWTRSSLEGDFFGEDAEDSQMSYHFGGGIEVPVSESIGVFGDFRYLNVDLDFGDLLARDIETSGWQANFGVNFYF